MANTPPCVPMDTFSTMTMTSKPKAFSAEWLRYFGRCHVQFILSQRHNVSYLNEEEDKLMRAAKALMLWAKLGTLDESRVTSIWSKIGGEGWNPYDVAFTEQPEFKRRFIIHSYRRLIWLYQYLNKYKAENNAKFVEIHKPYEVMISDIPLAGTIDAISKEDKAIESTVWVFDYPSREQSTWQVYNNPWIQSSAYAYRQLSGSNMIRLQYVNLMHKKVTRIYQQGKHIEQLAYMVRTATEIIREGLYYPVYNHECNDCRVKNECERGDWIEDRIYRQQKWESAAQGGKRKYRTTQT